MGHYIRKKVNEIFEKSVFNHPLVWYTEDISKLNKLSQVYRLQVKVTLL